MNVTVNGITISTYEFASHGFLRRYLTLPGREPQQISSTADKFDRPIEHDVIARLYQLLEAKEASKGR